MNHVRAGQSARIRDGGDVEMELVEVAGDG